MTTTKTSYSNVSAANPDVIFDISKIKNRNHLTLIGNISHIFTFFQYIKFVNIVVPI